MDYMSSIMFQMQNIINIQLPFYKKECTEMPDICSTFPDIALYSAYSCKYNKNYNPV